jgi:hypothetical protein
LVSICQTWSKLCVFTVNAVAVNSKQLREKCCCFKHGRFIFPVTESINICCFFFYSRQLYTALQNDRYVWVTREWSKHISLLLPYWNYSGPEDYINEVLCFVSFCFCKIMDYKCNIMQHIPIMILPFYQLQSSAVCSLSYHIGKPMG